MKYRKLTTILFAFVLIIACASCSECWIAQEYTQITVKIKAVAEWLNTIEMKLNGAYRTQTRNIYEKHTRFVPLLAFKIASQ